MEVILEVGCFICTYCLFKLPVVVLLFLKKHPIVQLLPIKQQLSSNCTTIELISNRDLYEKHHYMEVILEVKLKIVEVILEVFGSYIREEGSNIRVKKKLY